MAVGTNINSTAAFKFPSIKLEEEGIYTIKFYVLMYCNDVTGCSNYEDYININASYGVSTNKQINDIYDFKSFYNLDGLRKWIQKSYSFRASATELKVIIRIYFI